MPPSQVLLARGGMVGKLSLVPAQRWHMRLWTVKVDVHQGRGQGGGKSGEMVPASYDDEIGAMVLFRDVQRLIDSDDVPSLKKAQRIHQCEPMRVDPCPPLASRGSRAGSGAGDQTRTP